jgi:UDP:flavonoid glycosyltransferase YjiC (YdhE family)
MSRILFVSGSIGLGHVTRDTAIAAALRDLRPDVTIDWLATPPAKEYLRERGERVLAEADQLLDPTRAAEGIAARGGLDINRWAFGFRKQWAANGRICLDAMKAGGYDLFIGDETYDVAMQVLRSESPPTFPVFVLYDFLGLDATSRSPLDRLIVLGFNRVWSTDPKGRLQPVFIGEREDIPLRPFVPFGPSRRAWAERYALIVDHVLDFDPAVYIGPAERAAVRARLGYGPEPTVVVSVGGTAVGEDLVRRCLDAFPAAREAVDGLRMRVVCGPRMQLTGATVPEGVEVLGYVPKLYEHFAACDLAIVQAGATTTLELTALKRPFLYFPLENHCEQLLHVAPRQRRLGAGVELVLRNTPARELARRIEENVGKQVTYKDVPTKGAQQLAEHVLAAIGAAAC